MEKLQHSVGGDKPSFHRSSIHDFFAGRVNFTQYEASSDKRLFVLAFTNRSGSNLLSDYLLQTDLVGGLGEYLNQETVIKKSLQNKLDTFPDYINFISSRLSTGSHAFGIKASAEQLKMLIDWNITGMFSETFIFHIRRDDIFRQAVSHWIATQTGQWTSLQPKRKVELVFNGDKIINIVNDIVASNSTIHYLCARGNINYTSVSYQEVLANPSATVSRLMNAAGLDVRDRNLGPPKLSRQSDETNDIFIGNLLAYLGQTTK